MKLYYATGACSLASHIVVEELGVEVEKVKVNLRERENRKPEYLAINWKGKVPALGLDDGQVLTENPVIEMYLADTHPKGGLLAALGEPARYRALEWLAWSSSFVQPLLGPLFHNPTPEQRENGQKALDTFSHRLDGKSYVLGDRFSIADSYTLVFLGWAKLFKLELGAGHKAAAEKLLARPAVQRALAVEGLKLEV